MLILASASPRRRELLARVGVRFEVRPADIDERELPGEPPRAYVERVASAKAATLAHADAWVLAADTTVVLDHAIFGKAEDGAHAAAMLRQLRGRTHQVITAVVLQRGGEVHRVTVSTEVELDGFDDATLADYLASGEWRGKAGAYAVQGIGAALVRGVRGSITNVVGLPLAEVVALLRATGAAPVCLAEGVAA
ncbi:MAG: Maf family protein [Kofleriaceae bacterium]